MDSGIVAKNLDPTSNACDWMQDWQMSYRPQPRAPRFVYPSRALSCRGDSVAPAKQATNILSLVGRLFQPRMLYLCAPRLKQHPLETPRTFPRSPNLLPVYD